MSKGVDSPPNILRQKLEDARHLRSEFPHTQIAIQKRDAFLQILEEIVQIVGHLGQLDNLPLVLRVDRVQLFVDRV